MSKKIITISREFGSGGRFIGEEVAKKLGMPITIRISSVRLQKSRDFLRNTFRKMRNSLQRRVCLAMLLPDATLPENPWKIWCTKRRKVILEIAEKESCVIIGRNADFILKDRDDVLNVFIHGDMPQKVKRICRLYTMLRKRML